MNQEKLNVFLCSIDELEKETEGWDGYGARAPNPDSGKVMREFIQALMKAGLEPENAIEACGLDPDGEFSIEWYNQDSYKQGRWLGVSTAANGDLAFAYTDHSDMKNNSHGTVHFDSEVPETLVKLIVQVKQAALA